MPLTLNMWLGINYRAMTGACCVLSVRVSSHSLILSPHSRSVTDPRDGKRVALKKMPNVFQNLVSCKRVFRELKMLCFFKHDNVSGWKPSLLPPLCQCPPLFWSLPLSFSSTCHLPTSFLVLSYSLSLSDPSHPPLPTDVPDLLSSPQVLSALDILQPPHIDYFEEMYP